MPWTLDNPRALPTGAILRLCFPKLHSVIGLRHSRKHSLAADSNHEAMLVIEGASPEIGTVSPIHSH